MTIYEAEQQYSLEVADCTVQRKNKFKKAKRICIIISSVLILFGIILIIIGFTAPPEINAWGHESTSTAAILEWVFGSVLLFLGVLFISIILPLMHVTQKYYSQYFLPQTKNLYYNYLKCEDMSDNDKEFYKQKLEDLRNMELVNAIHSASTAISTAIMHNTLHK